MAESYFFLDWCPGDMCSSAFEGNQTVWSNEIDRLVLIELHKNYLPESELQLINSVKYSARKDGIFIFELVMARGVAIEVLSELSILVSEDIKADMGHYHTFHYGKNNVVSATQGHVKTTPLDPDEILAVLPVQLKPVAAESEKNVDFENLARFLEDNVKLAAMQAIEDVSALRLLRNRHSEKLSNTLSRIAAYKIASKVHLRAFWTLAVIVYALIALILWVFGGGWGVLVGLIVFSSAAIFGIYSFLYARQRRIPIIRILRSLSGFYAYVSVFANGVLCIEQKDGPQVGYSTSEKVIQTVLNGEIEVYQYQQKWASALLAVASLFIALISAAAAVMSVKWAEVVPLFSKLFT